MLCLAALLLLLLLLLLLPPLLLPGILLRPKVGRYVSLVHTHEVAGQGPALASPHPTGRSLTAHKVQGPVRLGEQALCSPHSSPPSLLSPAYDRVAAGDAEAVYGLVDKRARPNT